MRRAWIVTTVATVAAGITAAPAQQSASYQLEEQVLNAGGHPSAGISPASTTYRITRGSIGDSLLGGTLASSSFQIGGGFLAAYPPPGEVAGLDLPAPSTLVWDPEHSAGVYNVYRSAVSTLPGLAYGACDQAGLTATSTTAGGNPAPGIGFFYMVTVENSLGEEGTKGFQAGGARRAGTTCP